MDTSPRVFVKLVAKAQQPTAPREADGKEWIACDACNRWRRIPVADVPADADAPWHCGKCDEPEESWDPAEWRGTSWLESEPCGTLIAPGWTLLRPPKEPVLTPEERADLCGVFERVDTQPQTLEVWIRRSGAEVRTGWWVEAKPRKKCSFAKSAPVCVNIPGSELRVPVLPAGPSTTANGEPAAAARPSADEVLAVMQALQTAKRTARHSSWQPVPAAEGWLVRWKVRGGGAKARDGERIGDTYFRTPRGDELRSISEAQRWMHGAAPEGQTPGCAHVVFSPSGGKFSSAAELRHHFGQASPRTRRGPEQAAPLAAAVAYVSPLGRHFATLEAARAFVEREAAREAAEQRGAARAAEQAEKAAAVAAKRAAAEERARRVEAEKEEARVKRQQEKAAREAERAREAALKHMRGVKAAAERRAVHVDLRVAQSEDGQFVRLSFRFPRKSAKRPRKSFGGGEYEEPSYTPVGSSSRPHSKRPRVTAPHGEEEEEEDEDEDEDEEAGGVQLYEAGGAAESWVACERCDKWRRVRAADTPRGDQPWFCTMHPDARFASCDAPEEAWDEEEWEEVPLEGRKRQWPEESAAPGGASEPAAGSSGAAAAEAQGVRLHLSSSSSTGYKCVKERSTGRFEAKHSVGGKKVYLGTFGTAVEAAVAYARAAGEAPAAADGEEVAAAFTGIAGGGGSSHVRRPPPSLPPGWSVLQRMAEDGRKRSAFTGPGGGRAASLPDAWRKYRERAGPAASRPAKRDRAAQSDAEGDGEEGEEEGEEGDGEDLVVDGVAEEEDRRAEAEHAAWEARGRVPSEIDVCWPDLSWTCPGHVHETSLTCPIGLLAGRPAVLRGGGARVRRVDGQARAALPHRQAGAPPDSQGLGLAPA